MKTPILLFAMTLAAWAQALGTFEGQSDVGSPSQAGAAKFSGGEYQITGGGANIWGTADAFHYVWKKVSGDFSLATKLHFVGTGKIMHRKAGILVRQTLQGGSPWAGVMLHGDGLTSLQYRETADGLTKEVRSTVSAPAKIRLVRKGDTFTMYVAKEGEPLAESGSMKVSLADPVYVGLGVCSHDDTVTETAVFSEVEWSN